MNESACVYVYMYVCVTCVHVCDEHVCMCVMHMCVCVCMCVYVCTHVCGYVYLCEYICMCRPVARSGNRGVRKTNVDLTSGRWPRWVARYEKGGWAVHFRADIRKVGGGGGGGAIRFRSITKSGVGGQFASGPLRKVGGGQFASGPLRKVGGGGGGNSLQVHYEKWGGGGAIRFRSITKSGGGGGQFASGPLRKVGGRDVSSPIGVWGKAPEASQAGTRTTKVDLDPFRGGGFVRTPQTPPGYGLDVCTCMHASVWLCVCMCSSCKKVVSISASAMQTCACM